MVTFINNGVTGGDAGYVYTGSLQETEGTLKGQLAVQQHDRSAPSVFGGLGDFTLPVTGAAIATGANLTGYILG
ncbi:MAG: hypothetical protein PGN08_02455 [Sphingomonas taxi]